MAKLRQSPSARKNITPYINPSPEGIDRIITDLQEDFTAKLPWLQKSFGKVERMHNKGEDNTNKFFPGVWVDKQNDPINLLADDNYGSYTFSFPIGKASPLGGEINAGINFFERNLAVIFWFNLPTIDSAKTNDFTEDLMIEIERVIRKTRFSGIDSVDINDATDIPEEIFPEFTVSLTDQQNLIYPYRACRFDLTAYYSSSPVCLS